MLWGLQQPEGTRALYRRRKLKAIQLTDEGINRAEEILVIHLYRARCEICASFETAVRAQALFIRDKEYVVQGDEVIIVDEFTGRLQPGRRWSEGLHQAVEAKEGVKIQQESRIFCVHHFPKLLPSVRQALRE